MKDNKLKRRYTYSTFLGFILLGWQILIYRKTIIDPKLLFAMGIVASIIGMVFIVKSYNRIYQFYSGPKVMFFSVLQSIISFGFTIPSIFILMNYYVAQEKLTRKIYPIISRSSISNSRHRNQKQPTFEIQYTAHYRKKLVFSHEFYVQRKEFTSIQLDVKQGLFGFDIVEKKVLF